MFSFDKNNSISIVFLAVICIFIIVSTINIMHHNFMQLNIKYFFILFALLVLVLFVGIKYFKDDSINIKNNTILFMMVLTSIFVILAQSIISLPENEKEHLKIFDNPLFPTFQRIAKKYNLDLNFTKKVWIGQAERAYMVNDIFNQQKHSVDILFFADSTIGWGVIPQVIEQITGKKVAIYAYNNNVLTTATSHLYEKLANYYLKKDGIVLFSFDNKNKSKGPRTITLTVRQYKAITHWRDENFEKFRDKTKLTFFDKYLSYKAYKKKYKEISAYIKVMYHLGLKSPPIYLDYIEKYANPKLYKKKMLARNSKTKPLKWDNRTYTTQYNPEFKSLSIPNKDMPKKELNDKAIKENAISASKVFDGDEVYIVNLYSKKDEYILSRNIYYTYYKKLGIKLCDLGKELKDNNDFIMKDDEDRPTGYIHMGNQGGLMKSILIGKWLKRYLKNRK